MCWRAIIVLTLSVVAAEIPAAAQDISDINVPSVANAPFSAVVHVQRTIIRRNGSVANLTATRDIGRDHLGRIYDARYAVASPSQTAKTPLVRIQLYDSQTGIWTTLFCRDHTFVRTMPDDPPSPRAASMQASSSETSSNDYMKEEKLGTREIGGVLAQGIRRLKITPAEAGGKGKEVVISDEYWYSEDLRMYLMIKHDDPRSGSVSMTLDEISRSEPDPARFEIPSVYKRKN